MDTRHIKIDDYNYTLLDERIAKFPMAQRDRSKLLVYRKGDIKEDIFYNISEYLPSGALMVFNNTKVIQARLHFRKETGALIEIFLLEPAQPSDYEQVFQAKGKCSWFCMIGNLKKWKTGPLIQKLNINGEVVNLTAIRGNEHGTSFLVEFEWDNDEIPFSDIIEQAGELPIPPYLNRETQESDKVTYQTVYSKIKGSVAAPTAGLHFTEDVFRSIEAAGVVREEITLHVGAGTFKPVKSDDIGGHAMHTEYVAVHRSTLENLLRHGAGAIAVGTTSVRTLESLYYMGVHLSCGQETSDKCFHVEQWEPYDCENNLKPDDAIRLILDYLDRNNMNVLHGSTQIIIAPGYEYKIVKMLVTNFHQPKSTLLLLVSAFVNGDWKHIYDYALSHDFRFLSYGDSSLLIP